MLKSILIVTISVLHLGSVEKAFDEFLDYEVVERGVISAELAGAWDTPGMADRDYVLMQPESKAPVYIRFVENEYVADYEPITSYGWNATELLVKDPDAVAERLSDSPFAIIGPPKDLWAAPNAPRAMQTLGPGNEVLYLTTNANFTVETDIDRVFIMVVGGPSMDAMSAFYRDQLGLEVGDAMPFSISVVSRAQGLPADTTYPLAVATVSKDFLIELDEYPAAATPRTVKPGFLPPGTSMVTFEVDGELDDLAVDWRVEPREVDGFPYDGREVGVTTGAAGEWIELIEAEDDDSDSD
ncbi:MAG: VOC family protein [Gammaproteobacteria bacterium]